MKILKYIKIAILLILTTNSIAQENKSSNYVVLLDLSDRILCSHQKEYDIKVINSVFQKFESSVRSKFFLKSEDSFSVRIIPQAGTPIDAYEYGELLSINMSSIMPQSKVKEFNAFKQCFSNHLIQLYDKARFSDKKSDYKGVDIWRYFNESIEYDLQHNKNNSIVILTDGYMDFEAYPKGFKDKNKFTSTSFFAMLRCQNWKSIDAEKDYGLIPLNKLNSFRTSIVLAGIRPKSHIEFLDESNMIKYFWNKWFDEMQINKHKTIGFATSPSVYLLISSTINDFNKSSSK